MLEHGVLTHTGSLKIFKWAAIPFIFENLIKYIIEVPLSKKLIHSAEGSHAFLPISSTVYCKPPAQCFILKFWTTRKLSKNNKSSDWVVYDFLFDDGPIQNLSYLRQNGIGAKLPQFNFWYPLYVFVITKVLVFRPVDFYIDFRFECMARIRKTDKFVGKHWSSCNS